MNTAALLLVLVVLLVNRATPRPALSLVSQNLSKYYMIMDTVRMITQTEVFMATVLFISGEPKLCITVILLLMKDGLMTE